ncbi:MAG: bacterioferritin [Alphaproteobacteria bacterium]|uniref:bacterioferritin n=1 Tax=Alexandriicola marinus TaxID=2081710 RepID=UPI000FD9F273|nr:bacterioferritin [Alexandriicola marinus]MBM1221435.1 bacterioferritin [Ponticoccus sp. SC6-9]MBM1226476.1 bacterioferritin [Ponticoccus sp. SC6-15]MBM1230427.1 bacterioferritin [Ponticoccus sp. SC6-38]MBM1234950.1 bacterioferritin [Ponticoccus sp. SC6-45]MBM1239448.1 bacterioferritin [Ponticoccus sp. SC6-49]MBM1243230.1 bacterioferritin [Ponticoccus sp. SC2-64]MBM1248474.1 bacterioferritin [Ponticoccus sp. SC6-42]MBM1253059.1 bacterioferritin [Ponticoccus sp. SC6-33]MBM1257457.1 bacter
MTDHSKSIENLQTALAMELTAVNQYLLHAHTLEDWGLDKLANRMREEMQEELGHAGQFIDRIMFLGGTPELSPTKTPAMAETLQSMFEDDKTEEKGAIEFYSKAARDAYEANDIGTRTLFETIVIDEEGHWDWLDRQLATLKRMGEPAFMSIYMSGDSTGA